MRLEKQTESKRNDRQHSFLEKERAVALYEQGLSSKQIGQKLNLDDSMVRCWIRKYRRYGMESLRPSWRSTSSETVKNIPSLMGGRDKSFQKACRDFAGTKESLASIVRRYGLSYHSFRYYIHRYHPELVAERRQQERR